MRVEEGNLLNLINMISAVERASSINAVMLSLLQLPVNFMDFDYSVFFLFNEKSKKAVRHAIVQHPGIDAPVRELLSLIMERLPRYFESEDSALNGTGYESVHEWSAGSGHFALDGARVLTGCFAEGFILHGALCVCRNGDVPYSEFDHFVLRAFEPTVVYKMKTFLDAGHIEAEKRKEFEEQFGLSTREIEVAECITNGMNAIDIANKLNISTRTVNKHLEHIYRKTGVNNRLSLIRFIQVYLHE